MRARCCGTATPASEDLFIHPAVDIVKDQSPLWVLLVVSAGLLGVKRRYAAEKMWWELWLKKRNWRFPFTGKRCLRDIKDDASMKSHGLNAQTQVHMRYDAGTKPG